MSRELKSCPFCGGKAKVLVCDGSGHICADVGVEVHRGRKMTHCLIKCTVCRIRTDAYLTRRGAFSAWNRRADVEKKLQNPEQL
jgi:hypothetical protein